MADDIITTLRSLANRWTMLARDYARASKEAGATEAQVSYNRGYAEGYYKAATELAAVIKEQETAAPQRPAAPTQPRPAAPAQPPPPQGGRRPGASTSANAPQQQRPPAPPQAPPEPTITYASITVGEALSVLEFAGCAARDVIQNKDNSFRGIFSRWENMMPHDRLERIQKVDNRIIILSSGRTETQDHFVDFAFKDN